MQIASMSPEYVSRNDMPQDVVAHERQIQEELVANDPALAAKPEKVKAGIIEGRVSKSLQDMCLVDQIFFLDQDKKCGQYLKENGADVEFFDPYISSFKENGIVMEGIPSIDKDIIAQYDLVMITCGHTNVDYDMIQKNAKAIFDTKNVMQGIANRENIEVL